MAWPEQSEAKQRRAFLNTLQDPAATFVQALKVATYGALPVSEVIDEVVGYLEALPAKQRPDVLRRAAAELGADAAWLLQAAIHFDDLESQRLALAELLRLRVLSAVEPMCRLVKTTGNAALRAEAEAAARRLRMATGANGVERLELPPLEQALATVVDGDGGQALLVVRTLGEGSALIADFFHNDLSGVKGAFGTTRSMADKVEELVEGFAAEGIPMVEVDLASIRGALTASLAANAVAGHGVPPSFELWEPWLHDVYPPLADEVSLVPELDDTLYARRQDLVRSSGKLGEHRWFDTWSFEPEVVAEAMVHVPPPSGLRLGDRQLRPMLARILDPSRRARLRSRLRRQAWLLERIGDLVTRDRALAVAAQLADSGPSDLTRQPFLRQLLDRGLASVVSDFLVTDLPSLLQTLEIGPFDEP